MMVNRGRLDIMAHILGTCIKPQLKTRIMYDVNITFSQFGTYATLLQTQGLLIQEESRYVTTTKGLQFVNAFIQLQSILNGSNLLSSPNRLIKSGRELGKPPITLYV
jgi:predicted transcriptional regulator